VSFDPLLRVRSVLPGAEHLTLPSLQDLGDRGELRRSRCHHGIPDVERRPEPGVKNECCSLENITRFDGFGPGLNAKTKRRVLELTVVRVQRLFVEGELGIS
jgi:hypothetical protein